MISRLLALLPEAEPSTSAVAERSVWLWERIADNLIPLVGEVGFQSLYGRAVHLALPQCPGFGLLKQGKSTAAILEGLEGGLVALEHEVAVRCSQILLREFADLVGTMIGDALMEQILCSVRDDRSSRKKE